jgi:hypothetical protein
VRLYGVFVSVKPVGGGISLIVPIHGMKIVTMARGGGRRSC